MLHTMNPLAPGSSLLFPLFISFGIRPNTAECAVTRAFRADHINIHPIWTERREDAPSNPEGDKLAPTNEPKPMPNPI